MNQPETAIKNIVITATMAYPIVSAYEFEFLKDEPAFQKRLKDASIYFILQRPLMYFDNMTMADGTIEFDIVDTLHAPLRGSMNLAECKITAPDEEVYIDTMFYKKEPNKIQPFTDVAGFKVFRKDGSFIVWESPHKMLYEAIVKGLPIRFVGNVNDYLDYDVHYIGKAFAQDIWHRLTGHATAQKILTLEAPRASKNALPTFEISLLLLRITDAHEVMYYDTAALGDTTPILHEIDTDVKLDAFNRPWIINNVAEMTSEVEAMLVSRFKPQYNVLKFDNYPNILKGTRSLGYTSAQLLTKNMPVVLKTADHTHSFSDEPIELEDQQPQQS